MYSLDINFLKDRQGDAALAPTSQRRRSAGAVIDWRPAYIGGAIGLLFPLLGLGYWWFLQNKGAELTQKQTDLQAKIDQLKVKNKEIDDLNNQVKAANDEVNALVAVFDKLKPWSALLQDISNRVPLNVRLDSIRQGKEEPKPPSAGQPAPAVPAVPRDAVILAGNSASYEEVNNFILKLKQSPFFDDQAITLKRAALIDDPAKPEIVENTSGLEITPKTRQVVAYEINAVLTDTPAPKMLNELEQLGAKGLVARIEALKQEGVLP